jgi:hypothetical protein
MSKVIDATLRFVDKFTSPMNNAIKSMERSAKQAQRMGKEIGRAGDKISNAGAGLTKSLTIPIATAGIASFKLASDMNESINKVDVCFGKSSKNIKKWSDTTLKSYGIAKGTSLDMAAKYGDMASAMGITHKQATNMSKKLVGLAGDLSSFKNVSVGISDTALTGIFTGETESLKQMGIVMTETNLQAYALKEGLLKSTVSADKMKAMSTNVSIAQQNLSDKVKKYGSNSIQAQKAQISLNNALEKQSKYSKGSFKDLSQAEKVQIRYKYVMDMTKNAHGDFARTSNGAANQMRIFTESVKELGAKFGTKLLPVGTKVITFVNNLVDRFSKLSDSQQNMVIKIAGLLAVVGPGLFIFGKVVSGISGAVTTFGKVGSAIKKAGSIMGLFTSPALIVVAVVAAIAVGAFLLIKNWTKVKNFFGKVGTTIKNVFNSSGGNAKKFGSTFTKVKDTVSRLVGSIGTAISKIIKFMKPIVSFLSKVFVAGFKVYLSMVGGYVSGLVTGISDAISGMMKILNGIIDFVSGVFTGNWSKAWNGVKEIFGGVFESFTALAKMPLNAVIGLINGAVKGINKLGLKIPNWVPVLGGKDFHINIPTMPMLSKGTKSWQGGFAITQERGGEVMDLPRGTRVWPHDESIKMAREEGKRSAKGGLSLTIHKLADKIEVRSDDDLDTLINGLGNKLESIYNNMGKVVPV